MLNQLENLTERVGGSNKLVDRWLDVRKHLLVAYYNLVGIKPGKESYMRLNEKALDDFCQSVTRQSILDKKTCNSGSRLVGKVIQN